MSYEYSLAEIPEHHYPKLRELFLEDWPSNYISFSVTEHSARHDSKSSQIYSVGGNIHDGLVHIDKIGNILHFCEFGNNLEKLKKALEDISFKRFEFIYFKSPKLIPLIPHLEIGEHRYVQETHGFFFLEKAKAFNLNIQERKDVFLKPLTLEDADIVNDLWPPKFPGSINYVEYLIKTDYSMGAFCKTTGNLVAWILRYPIGCLGILQVKREYYRRGLGKLVVTAISKKLGEEGLDCSVTINVKNEPSTKLFKSVGYEKPYDIFLYKNLNKI
uniref:N-acetyltransferase domain-containing protein n=1 Tax=Megaselia scalaris TaxID=36166 RepID=T1GKT9_MEGSC